MATSLMATSEMLDFSWLYCVPAFLGVEDLGRLSQTSLDMHKMIQPGLAPLRWWKYEEDIGWEKGQRLYIPPVVL